MVQADDTTAEAQTETALERADRMDAENCETVLEAEIHGDTFETAFRQVEGVVDAARVQFSEEGVFSKAVDPENVTLARVFIPASEFEVYDLESAGIEGIDVSQFGKTLRGLKTRKRESDTLEFSIGESTRTGETVFYVADSEGSVEQVDVLNPLEVRTAPDIPELDYEISGTIGDGNELREFVKSINQKDVVTVTASSAHENSDENATLTFEWRVDVDDVNDATSSDYVPQDTLVVDSFELSGWGGSLTKRSVRSEHHSDEALEAHSRGPHGDNNAHVTGQYSAEYVKKWAKRLRKTRTEDVPYTIDFGDEWPMKVVRDDDSPIVTEFMVAPRIL